MEPGPFEIAFDRGDGSVTSPATEFPLTMILLPWTDTLLTDPSISIVLPLTVIFVLISQVLLATVNYPIIGQQFFGIVDQFPCHIPALDKEPAAFQKTHGGSRYLVALIQFTYGLVESHCAHCLSTRKKVWTF